MLDSDCRIKVVVAVSQLKQNEGKEEKKRNTFESQLCSISDIYCTPSHVQMIMGCRIITYIGMLFLSLFVCVCFPSRDLFLLFSEKNQNFAVKQE
jgi:hypothetical protein